MLEFLVSGQVLKRVDNFGVVADSVNYLKAKFDFSNSDFGGKIIAVFEPLFDEKSYEVEVINNEVLTPHEVIKASGFKISLICFNGNVTITTQAVTVRVVESGCESGETPQEPTPTVYQKLVDLTENAVAVANEVKMRADNGEFKGAQGDKGDTGLQGLPGKSGRVKWHKICRDTITEAVAKYVRDVDNNGNPLSDLKACIIRLKMPNWSTSARTTIYLNLRKTETGDEDYWTELSFVPSRISSTTGPPKLNQINIQVEPWIHGDFIYDQSSLELDSGELATIDQTHYYNNTAGGVFNYTASNFIDVIQFDTQVDDRFLPTGMVIEIWGAIYDKDI